MEKWREVDDLGDGGERRIHDEGMVQKCTSNGAASKRCRQDEYSLGLLSVDRCPNQHQPRPSLRNEYRTILNKISVF